MRPRFPMASGSGTGGARVPAAPPAAAAAAAPGKDCESCHSAPGVPFCRVEWSFLCPNCASVVHANNWIIAVPPNPNPSSNLFPFPYPYPHHFPSPNAAAAAAASDPNLVVQLSSSSDDAGGGGGRRGKRKSAGRGAPPVRVESVMRYREKRKNRRFDKTVRYENRKVYAELRPRVEGKFARPEGGGVEEVTVSGEAGGMSMPIVHEQLQPLPGEQVMQEVREVVLPFGREELGPADAQVRQEVREVVLPFGSEELGPTDAVEDAGLQ